MTRLNANFGKFDALNSTFRHEIICKNGFLLQGYSKGENIEEPHDKTILLMNVSYRLIKSGYLTYKGHEITFYRKTHLKDNDLKVITFRPTAYEIHDPEILTNFPFMDYLKNLYEKFLKGENIDPRPAKRFDNLTDKEKKDFEKVKMTPKQLETKCRNLLDKGYNRSLVIAYWHACKNL